MSSSGANFESLGGSGSGIPLAQKGAAEGVATLNSETKLPIAQVPKPNAGGYYEATFGNASATSFTIEHKLNTLTPNVNVINQSTSLEEGCKVEVINANKVKLSATAWEATPPGIAAYRVSVDASSGLVNSSGSSLTNFVEKGEIGANSGVAPLEMAGKLPESRYINAVVISGSEEVAEAVEGNISPAMPSNKRVASLTYTIKGNVTVKSPSGALSGFSEALIRVQQNSSGGHKISTSGIIWNGGEPVWNESANAINLISVFTVNGGSSWEGSGPPKGETGATGATGPEGFNPSKLLLATAWPIYKNTSGSTTENKSIFAEPFPRYETNNVITLTSGTPVICAIPVPEKKVISGIAWGIKTAEGTPANRTHLWAALLDSTGKILKRSEDYTSSTNSPMTGSTRRGIFLTETYETSSAAIYYAALCEVMSSTACMAVPQKSSEQIVTEGAPILAATGPIEQTGVPELGITWTLKGSTGEPWLGLF